MVAMLEDTDRLDVWGRNRAAARARPFHDLRAAVRLGTPDRQTHRTMIGYEDFERVEMRVGRIVRAETFPRARKPAYRLWIDFGEHGERSSSAQITRHYTPEQLVGRLVVAVTNFPPRQIADFRSEVLVLGVPDEHGDVVLLSPEHDVPPGVRVF